MQRYTVYFIWKLLYMFRVVPPPIIRSAKNCIYNIWYLSHRYCYLPLSWKSWNAVPTLPLKIARQAKAQRNNNMGQKHVLYMVDINMDQKYMFYMGQKQCYTW